MPTTYRATLTEVGAALVADAIASGTTLTWAKMALGDGNGSAVTVDPSRTSLVNEQYRAPLNDLGRDSANPNTIVGTLVVPPETGGWTIREFGIYDNAATPRLVAYGETPEIEKPASSAGTGINLRLRFKLVVSADANITLAPDSNEAYATIEYVKDNAVKSLSVSGRTITYTMGDGDTYTITTQDTTYSDATQSVHGLMSVTDKKKLDGIAASAEVNQNAFSNFKVGNVTVAADSKTDTLELVAGTGITLTPDATNDKVTIKVTDNTYADESHTHPYLSLSGGTMTGTIISNHIYSMRKPDNSSYLTFLGGQSGGASNGAKLTLTGAENEGAGQFILQAGNAIGYKQLIGYPDGTLTWGENDVIYTHPSYTSRTGKPTTNQTPSFGDTFTVSQITSDATGHVTGANDKTIKIPNSLATQAAAGLMSVNDKKKLDDNVVTITSSQTLTGEKTVKGQYIGWWVENLNNENKLGIYYSNSNRGLWDTVIGGWVLQVNSNNQIQLNGNAQTASKLGTSTVGSTKKPIYLSDGTATACSTEMAPCPKSSSGVGQVVEWGGNYSDALTSYTLPSGGTWFCVCYSRGSDGGLSWLGLRAGGTKMTPWSGYSKFQGVAWRVA